MHGEGIYIWQDKKKYKGGYLNGKRNGFGQIIYPDGREYIGEW